MLKISFYWSLMMVLHLWISLVTFEHLHFIFNNCNLNLKHIFKLLIWGQIQEVAYIDTHFKLNFTKTNPLKVPCYKIIKKWHSLTALLVQHLTDQLSIIKGIFCLVVQPTVFPDTWRHLLSDNLPIYSNYGKATHIVRVWIPGCCSFSCMLLSHLWS